MESSLRFLTVFLLLLFCTTIYGQKKITTESKLLQLNTPIAGELGKDDVDPYALSVKKDHFVFGFVDQLTVDVIVVITDPNGKQIRIFDSPGSGPEYFHFDAEVQGKYKIEVKPYKENEGAYNIQLVSKDPVATDPEKRVDQLHLAYDDEQTPGAVVGIVQNGEVIFSKAYGMANLTHNIPFIVDMPSNIGSVSKQFTAMSILLLEKEGKLSLDDDVRKHIPELPDFGQVITLKNLLNHTNGLRELYNTMPMTGWKNQDLLRRIEAIRMIQRQPALQVDPGEQFNYNNTAFILLAEIVKRTTGQEFPDWMQANIFDPLDMRQTMIRRDPRQIVPRGTQGYSGYSHGKYGYWEFRDLFAAFGAGGIYTTVEDLAKWLKNFKTPKVGDEALIEKLVTPGILNSGDTMSYALGIGVSDYRGLKRYVHTGGDNAHRAFLSYYPALDAGVIVMSNSSGYRLAIANQIEDAFFGDKMEPKKEKAKMADTGTVKVDPELLKSYQGKYRFEDSGFILEYKFENDKLVAYAQGQISRIMIPISNTSFTYDGVEAKVVFHPEAGKKTSKATHHQNGQKMKMVKMKPYAPSEEQLSAFTGKYLSEELETFYTITLKEGNLIAQHINLNNINFKPTEPDRFAGSVGFMQEVAFERDEDGQVIGFTASNGRTKGIQFVKQLSIAPLK